jgi:hypothetical protein
VNAAREAVTGVRIVPRDELDLIPIRSPCVLTNAIVLPAQP